MTILSVMREPNGSALAVKGWFHNFKTVVYSYILETEVKEC